MIVAVFLFPCAVPGSPMCPTRWEVAKLTTLTVNWTTPVKPNGIITAYYIQLFSFDNSMMISETSLDDLSTLKTVLSDLPLSEFLDL